MKYEYKISELESGETAEDLLREAGANGWELVAVESPRRVGEPGILAEWLPKIFYFKRAIE